jgi:vacuolar protein-sorting-associated protein 4
LDEFFTADIPRVVLWVSVRQWGGKGCTDSFKKHFRHIIVNGSILYPTGSFEEKKLLQHEFGRLRKDLTPPKKQQKAVEEKKEEEEVSDGGGEEEELTAVEVGKMTIPDLKTQLDKRGVKYGSKSRAAPTKNALVKLLMGSLGAGAAGGEEEEEDGVLPFTPAVKFCLEHPLKDEDGMIQVESPGLNLPVKREYVVAKRAKHRFAYIQLGSSAFVEQIWDHFHYPLAKEHRAKVHRDVTRDDVDFPVLETSVLARVLVDQRGAGGGAAVWDGKQNRAATGPVTRDYSQFFDGAKSGGDDDDEFTKKAKGMMVPIQGMPEWEQVAGMETTKRWLEESVMDPIRHPTLYDQKKTNRRAPTAALLYGPPGTGKTYLVKAFAKKVGAHLFNVDGKLRSKWHGGDENGLISVYEVARQLAERTGKPSIVFADECEGLCGSRSDTVGGDSDQATNALLTQMDGLVANTGVFTIANTNLPWLLDDAFFRRFTLKLEVPLPDALTRLACFKVYTTKDGGALTEEDFKYLVKATDGYSNADIKELTTKFALKENLVGDGTAVQLGRQHFVNALAKFKPSVTTDTLEKIKDFTRTLGTEVVEAGGGDDEDATMAEAPGEEGAVHPVYTHHTLTIHSLYTFPLQPLVMMMRR